MDDVSAGHVVCGLGTGGAFDSRILGESHGLGDRVSSFEEFVGLLDRLLTEDHIDHAGDVYRTMDARTLPGPVQHPRIPFVIAANGPRSLRLAARHGQGWITTGPTVETLDEWFASVGELAGRLDNALEGAGRDRVGFARYLLLDASPQFSLAGFEVFEDMAGRAGDLGFTDVITHWPRPQSQYAGELATLEAVASRFTSHRTPAG